MQKNNISISTSILNVLKVFIGKSTYLTWREELKGVPTAATVSSSSASTGFSLSTMIEHLPPREDMMRLRRHDLHITSSARMLCFWTVHCREFWCLLASRKLMRSKEHVINKCFQGIFTAIVKICLEIFTTKCGKLGSNCNKVLIIQCPMSIQLYSYVNYWNPCPRTKSCIEMLNWISHNIWFICKPQPKVRTNTCLYSHSSSNTWRICSWESGHSQNNAGGGSRLGQNDQLYDFTN